MDIERKTKREGEATFNSERLETGPRDDCTTIPTQSVLLFLVATLSVALLVDFFQNDCRYTNWPTFDHEKESKSMAQTLIQELDGNVAGEGVLQPTYAIFDDSDNERHLHHVKLVLERFGYDRVSLDEDWTLLWAHDYPFRQLKTQQLDDLSSYRIINHFPGCGFITSKVELSTTWPRPSYLPAAFRLPQQRQQFLDYVEQSTASRDVLFVVKNNSHRDIIIRNVSDIDLNSNDTFIQEFIANPFLIDGYKFDIGVYVVITSIDPLRIYFYTGDVLLRFCSIRYYPFVSKVIDKYVVGDDYLPIWQVPSLTAYYNTFEGNMRETLNAYIREKRGDNGDDPSRLWSRIEDIIVDVIRLKEPDWIRYLSKTVWKDKRNFFELIRFDLIVDEELNVFLMEANMSPNLSSAHFQQNAMLYEQVLYSVLNLVNVGSSVKRVRKTFSPGGSLSQLKEKEDKDKVEDENTFDMVRDMITSSRNLATNLLECHRNDCHRECRQLECSLCLPCLTGSEYAILETAHREQLHRVNMKRLFPKPIMNPENFDIETEVQNMTRRNAWLTRWYYHKCRQDILWCH